MRKWIVRRRWCPRHEVWEWAAYAPDASSMTGFLATWADAMLYVETVERRQHMKFARSASYGIR